MSDNLDDRKPTASEQTAIDLMTKHFEGTAEPADGADADTKAPETYKVEVNGEIVDVTMEQLQAGYLRQADYTKKTQDIGSQRERMETQLAEMDKERSELVKNIDGLSVALSGNTDGFVPNFRALSDDPAVVLQLQEQWAEQTGEYKNGLQQLSAERSRLETAREAVAKDNLTKHMRNELEIAQTSIDGWSTPEGAQKGLQQVHEYLVSQGIPKDALDQMASAAVFTVANKARMYDAAMAAMKDKTKVEPKAAVGRQNAPAPKRQYGNSFNSNVEQMSAIMNKNKQAPQ